MSQKSHKNSSNIKNVNKSCGSSFKKTSHEITTVSRRHRFGGFTGSVTAAAHHWNAKPYGSVEYTNLIVSFTFMINIKELKSKAVYRKMKVKLKSVIRRRKNRKCLICGGVMCEFGCHLCVCEHVYKPAGMAG